MEENGNPLQSSCLENLMDRRALVGYSPWGRKELDTTKRQTLSLSHLKLMKYCISIILQEKNEISKKRPHLIFVGLRRNE